MGDIIRKSNFLPVNQTDWEGLRKSNSLDYGYHPYRLTNQPTASLDGLRTISYYFKLPYTHPVHLERS